MRGFAVIALLFGATGFAAAQEIAIPAKRTHGENHAPLLLLPAHLPRPRPPAIPEQYAPPQEAFAAFPERAGAAAPSGPSECQLRLAKIATFKPLPLLAGPGECGATDAVAMDGVLLPDHATVVLAPPATLRCTMAEAVAVWLREDVASAALKLGGPLRGVDNYDSYECRGRNRVRGATLSEHGRANALDVRAVRFANGQSISLTDRNVPRGLRESVLQSVCARFSTVLGPGSDWYHEDHIHLDLMERHNNYRICQWNVWDPLPQVAPLLPAERPAEAPQREKGE